MKNSFLTQTSILVVGDAMIDRYWFGDATRISPEAPVPVVKIQRQEDRLGGAANVARNISSLGGRVSFLSIVGNDNTGEKLEELLKSSNITPFLCRSSELSTTVKIRIVAHTQQVLRTDFESSINENILDDFEFAFDNLLSDYHLVVFSDYGKGSLYRINRLIKIAKSKGKIILIDPKGEDYTKYAGADIITPNRTELSQLIGNWKSEEELDKKAQNLRKTLGLKKLLLTRSEEGMTLFDEKGAWTVPAQAKEVFDVSGAGDTVIAVLAFLLANGYSWRKAVKLANKAGGIVVGKLGTSVITPKELFN